MIWHIGSCIGIFALAVLRLSVMTLFVVTTNQVARRILPFSVGPLASFSCRTSVPLPIRAEYGTHHSLNGGFLAVNKYCSSPHRSRRSFNPSPT